MSQVKRYHTDDRMYEEADGDYVKASDYDALAAVCRELMEYAECRHEGDGNCEACDSIAKLKAKALAILGGEKGEGV